MKKCLTSQSTWKGVAVLAKHPTRALPAGLPQHIQDSGRALLFTSLLGDVWISGAVVYGEPNAHHYPAYQRNNEHLLHHVASHICNLSSGPRFVSGDWNVSQNSLPAFDLLTHAGFRDIQDVALERWGHPIQSTCKGRTRRDFLYISPELQDILVGVDVVHDVWPDHSVLKSFFHKITCAPSLWVWPTPDQFPWPNQFAEDVAWPGDMDMTEAYAATWAAIETSACANVPFPVNKNMCGRASRDAPKKVRNGLFSPCQTWSKRRFST